MTTLAIGRPTEAHVALPWPASRVPAARSGFSLLELVLVLSLLVVLAAFIWPSLEKPFASERLRKGADQVRTEWTRARIRAMTSGVPVVFHYQPESNLFTVESWGGLEVELEAADMTAFGVSPSMAPAAPVAPGAPVAVGQRQLPEGVLFFTSQSALDARSFTVAPAADSSAAGQILSAPILFYPDGTTSDATLILRNEHSVYILIELRGLTGVVTMTDLLTAEELPQ